MILQPPIKMAAIAMKSGIAFAIAGRLPICRARGTTPKPYASPTSTMSFDSATLTRLARLALIDIAPNQLPALGGEMSSILKLIDALQAVDTEGIAPMAHPLSAIDEMTLRCRADIAAPIIDRAANMQNAAQTENGLFLVPKVLD